MRTDTKTILVVEDDPGIRSLLVAVLSRSGFAVETASNGDVAARAIQERSHGAILLDLLMPVASGYDFLQRARKTNPDIGTRVIVITAASQSELLRHDVAAQTFKVLRKPFDLEELLQTVAECLQQPPASLEDPRGFLGLRSASEAARAKSAVVGVLNPSRQHVQLLWSYGYNEDINVYYPLPLSSDTPIGTSIVERRPVWVASREEAARMYPSLLATMEHHGTQALAAAPIMSRTEVAGSMGWTFANPQPFDEEQQRLLLRIAEQYSHVVSA